jgi:glyoxylase-like metal-dependent hydrolase (beta-lactamase superfamily II)
MNPTQHFSIRSAKGGYDHNFSYLVTCLETGEQCLIDPALPPETFDKYISSALTKIIITHTHGDHIAYLNAYQDMNPQPKIICHPLGKDKFQSFKIHPVQNEEKVTIGNLAFKILHTPGHYPDSICILLENILFTGDTLFVGRTGRVVSSGSNIQDLYHSVYDTILNLPQKTIIYPGHDYGDKSTISLDENIKISPLLQAIDENDFISKMNTYEQNR